MKINDVVICTVDGILRFGVLIRKNTTEDAQGERERMTVRTVDFEGESKDYEVDPGGINGWTGSIYSASNFIERCPDLKRAVQAADELDRALEASKARPASEEAM